MDTFDFCCDELQTDRLCLDVDYLFFQGPPGQRGSEGPAGKPGEDVSQLLKTKLPNANKKKPPFFCNYCNSALARL